VHIDTTTGKEPKEFRAKNLPVRHTHQEFRAQQRDFTPRRLIQFLKTENLKSKFSRLFSNRRGLQFPTPPYRSIRRRKHRCDIVSLGNRA